MGVLDNIAKAGWKTRPTSLSLKQIILTSSLTPSSSPSSQVQQAHQNAAFLSKEIPQRLAFNIQFLTCLKNEQLLSLPQLMILKKNLYRAIGDIEGFEKRFVSLNGSISTENLKEHSLFAKTLHQHLLEFEGNILTLRTGIENCMKKEGTFDASISKESDAVGILRLVKPSPGRGISSLDLIPSATLLRDCVNLTLDQLYFSLIGLKVLHAHFENMVQRIKIGISSQVPLDTSGMAIKNCNVLEVAQDAAMDATVLCVEKVANAPRIDFTKHALHGNYENAIVDKEKDVEMGPIPGIFVESYMHYVFGEVYKNALGASILAWGRAFDVDFGPPIETIVVETKRRQEDTCFAKKRSGEYFSRDRDVVAFRIRDFGCGIPQYQIPCLFHYFYSTVPYEEPTYTNSANFGAQFAGIGVGLPLARLYVAYHGGTLDLHSLEGYGTDVDIVVPRQGFQTCDNGGVISYSA
eukprot:Nk52_evm74s226 gene=Nk52_evmTU74s226